MGVLDDIKGRRVLDRHSICEVHRELYDHCIVELQNNTVLMGKLTALIEEAYVMGIKMSKKLVEYKYDTYQDSLPNDVDAIKQLRARRIELTGD